MLEIRVLGQFSVAVDEKPVEIPTRQAQSLLAYLVISAGKVHEQERLTKLIWRGSTESEAETDLRKALFKIRKVIGKDRLLGEEYVLINERTVAFNAKSNYWSDVDFLKDFDRQASADKLISELSEVGGELLPNLSDDWIILERERLRLVFEQKLNLLLNNLVQEERWNDVLEWGERWIALGEVPEPAYQALMLAHGSSGDINSAIAVYQRGSKALKDRLGVEPAPRTREILVWLLQEKGRGQGGRPEIGSMELSPAIRTQNQEKERAITDSLLKLGQFPEGMLLNQRYRLEEEISRGGMGIVSRGYDTLLDRNVAIKVLSASALNQEVSERILSEAQAIAKINHPNIVILHDAGKAYGVYFLVMELLEGHPLSEKKPATIDEAIDISMQICQGLSAVHALGIIHRDLKPENVMITSSGTVKLMDFGIARFEATRLTMESDFIGTVFYLSPEQALGKEIDQRTDLYAMGVMLYEMTTGKLPFEGGDALTVIAQHLHREVEPPNKINPAIPLELDQVIIQLLRKSPDERPDSVEEVLQVLGKLKEQIDSEISPEYERGLIGDESGDRMIGVPEGDQDSRIADLPTRIESKLKPRDGGAVYALLERWHKQDLRILDLSGLAIIHGSPPEITFNHRDNVLLIRSVLYRDVDLEPWLKRAGSREQAVAALDEVFREYPKAHIRLKIVEALVDLEGPEATEALFNIATTDDSPVVRSKAAVATARRGKNSEVSATLRKEMLDNDDLAAQEAFIAIADEVGLPEEVDAHPKFWVTLALFQRRWRKHRQAIMHQSIRTCLGAGGALVLSGLAIPFFVLLTNPEEYQVTLNEITLPAWMMSGALGTVLIGVVVGFAMGLAVGLADAIWQGKARRVRRIITGSAAGLAMSFILILYTMFRVPKPPTNPGIYNLVFIVYGFSLGASLSFVIPKLGESVSLRLQALRSTYVAILSGILTLPVVILVFQDLTNPVSPFILSLTVMLSYGIGLALSK